MSPTQRSLKLLRERGCLAEVVEHYNFFSKRRHDLWGFVDILVLDIRGLSKPVLAIQTTTKSNMSARKKKILSSPNYPIVKEAGIAIAIHGWYKRRGKWDVEIMEL